MVGVGGGEVRLGVLMVDMVESGIGAGIAHSDSVEVVVVEGVLVVVSCARDRVHVVDMQTGFGSRQGGVTLSGSVSLIEHTRVEVTGGGVTSIGNVLSWLGVGGWGGGDCGAVSLSRFLKRSLRCILRIAICSSLVCAAALR